VYIAPQSRLVKGLAPGRVRAEILNPQSLSRLVLLAQNVQVIHNLCKLVSSGIPKGFTINLGLDYEILEKYSDNLIALDFVSTRDVPQTFIQSRWRSCP